MRQRSPHHRAVLLMLLCVFTMLATMLPGIGVPTITRAQGCPTLVLLPASSAPGGNLRVSGYDFPPDGTFDIYIILMAERDLMVVPLGQMQSDRGGTVAPTTLPLPSTIAPGDYEVLAASQACADNGPARASLTVRPAMGITLSPTAGPPGTVVNVTVSNLVAGSLRLDYAGTTVLGPLAVSSGSYSGSFVVPGDRPDPLGTPTTMQAVNLVGGLAVGRAEAGFQSQAGLLQPRYQVTGLQLPTGALPAGSQFTIHGQITPAPQGPLSQYQVLPIWKTARGKSFPIGVGPAQITASGSFEVLAKLPSLKKGDPAPAKTGDQVGVVLVAPGTPPQPFLQAGPKPPSGATLYLEVFDQDTLKSIEGAKVDAIHIDEPVQGGLYTHAGAIFAENLNQIAGSMDEAGDNNLTDEEKLQKQIEESLCREYIQTRPVDPFHRISPVVDPAVENFSSIPIYQGILLKNAVQIDSARLQPGTPGVSAVVLGQSASTITYRVFVDALAQGYGEVGADGKAKIVSFDVIYHTSDGTYHDTQGKPLANPLPVPLKKLPDNLDSPLGNLVPLFAGPLIEQGKSDGNIVFGTYYSLTGLPADVKIPASTSADVSLSLTVPQYHLLAPEGMKFYLDDKLVGSFAFKFHANITCGTNNGVQTYNVPYYLGKLTLQNPHLYQPVIHQVRIAATLTSGKTYVYHYGLQVDPLPGSWFTPPAQSRTAVWAPSGVMLHTTWLNRDGNGTFALSSGDATPETGPLNNAARANVSFIQRIDASGNPKTSTIGKTDGQALNKDGEGLPFSLQAAVGTAGAASSAPQLAGFNKEIPKQTEPLVPTVTFDIPEAKYGIPFIAEVGVGGSMSYSASVTYSGNVTVQDDGSVQSLVTVEPSATTGGEVYIDAKLLSGIITSNGAALGATMTVHMPIVYDTAQGQVDPQGKYFQYSAYFRWWSKWGCGFWGCAYKKEGKKDLFKKPPCTGDCKSNAALSASSMEPQTASEPAKVDIALATDSFGTTMAIWPQSPTSLAVSLYDYNTNSWKAPQTIPTGLGSTGPQIAFFAPNRAVAAWTESSLDRNMTPEQLAAMSVEDLIKSQRMAYAVWNGTSWSASQAGPTVGLGEGGVALAGCMSTNPACPAGGAVTGVWERNTSADFAARQIRLLYATYQGGAWSAPQPLDPSSGATDILPQVAYRGGTPVVAWVRDSDADLTDISSRRVALRFLDGSPASVPTNLPGGIAEVALAVGSDGNPLLAFTRAEDSTRLLDNRRPLSVAHGSCSGSACTWSHQQLNDPYGRPIYAERPILTLDGTGKPTLTFRGLGFGPDKNGKLEVYPGDAPGMTFHTGELVLLDVNLSSATVVLDYKTQDGAVNWQPAAVFDPQANSTLAVAVNAPALSGLSQAQLKAARSASTSVLVPGLPVVFATTPRVPDFAVASIEPSTRYPRMGQPFSVKVDVHNSGAIWAGSADPPLKLVATWDGRPGVGAPAGEIALTAPAESQATSVTLDIAPPPDTLDRAHTLVVTVNPGQAIAEQSAQNNSQSVTLGGLPAPEGLVAATQRGSPLVFLEWQKLDDPRIAGYRVYRVGERGERAPVGSSFINGWVDINAALDQHYRYVVTSFTDDGVESAPGAPIDVQIGTRRIFLPLVVR